MAHTNGYAYQHSLNQWENYMFRCDYDEVMNDIPNFVLQFVKNGRRLEETFVLNKDTQFVLVFITTTYQMTLRWVAAFAVSHSEKYDYMR